MALIYFDNAATSLRKPPEVAQAMCRALTELGNPGRSAADPSMNAARAVWAARRTVADLIGLDDPDRVAFTSGCTESLNLLCRALRPEDRVVATELEHNAVLRPLRLSGCRLDILPCDAEGRLLTGRLERVIRPGTRFVFVSHGSNVTGCLTDIGPVREACRRAGAFLVLDASQTAGCARLRADMADILCFSGHKGLLGPMGTGCLIVRAGIGLPVLKTGGGGSDSFAPLQSAVMPDLAEGGTPNVPGICGLAAGIGWLRRAGLETVWRREAEATEAFLRGLTEIPGVRVYGDTAARPRLPVVSFAVGDADSAEIAQTLWERAGVATRPGAHCAPLLHRRLGTAAGGLVRCSFGPETTLAEIEQGLAAIREAAEPWRL